MSAEPERIHEHVEGPPQDGGVPSESPSGEAPSGDVPSKEEILDALRHVHDPELGVNIVDLGLVYEVEIDPDAGRVHIEYTLTTMGCPIGPLIESQMSQMLAGFPGIAEVDAEMVLRPPWSPEMMSEEAKAALGYF
ncbi:MAG: metal-sulfur cluster assembly factor [Actinobacteria bacterium]|nr:metal-sulfur cluster assembly factor [Actinomycetota bacterium]